MNLSKNHKCIKHVGIINIMSLWTIFSNTNTWYFTIMKIWLIQILPTAIFLVSILVVRDEFCTEFLPLHHRQRRQLDRHQQNLGGRASLLVIWLCDDENKKTPADSPACLGFTTSANSHYETSEDKVPIVGIDKKNILIPNWILCIYIQIYR